MEFGLIVAKSIDENVLISLQGDLGAGKTTISKGIVKGLNSSFTVTSPTYTILNIYDSSIGEIYHFDLYRLENEAELENIGYYDFIKNGVVLLEWADKFDDILPKNYILIDITYGENNIGRNVKISLFGKKYADIYEKIIDLCKKSFGDK